MPSIWLPLNLTWLHPGINETASLPTSVEGGHGLTLTGARKGTTADGVHGTGANTSNINAGANAVDNAAAKYWVSLRFRPDVDWASGDGDQYIWGKYVDATHYIRCRLDSATGNLIFEKNEGGATFSMAIASPAGDGIWHARVWYHVLCSISNTAAARFKVNDADLQTDADVAAMPNGGDLCFLDFDDPGAGTGFIGVEVDIFCGTDNLTGTEETDLFRGIPPADTVHEYPLDEGRGSTAYDRGSGADDGTLDTSCTWAFGQVQYPVLSLDGINDQGQSAAGLDIGGDVTWVHVMKAKSTYLDIAANPYQFFAVVDGANYVRYLFEAGLNLFQFSFRGIGVNTALTWTPSSLSIDDYIITIATKSGSNISLCINGILVDSETGAEEILRVGGATITLGATNVPDNFDISKPLFVGLIEGAFTPKQALAYSRYLKNVFNLPIDI